MTLIEAPETEAARSQDAEKRKAANRVVKFELLNSWLDATVFGALPRAQPWKLGLMAFAVYYLLPLLVTTATGVFLAPPQTATQLNVLGEPLLTLWLSRSPSLSAAAETHGSGLYYARDTTHLLMAIVTAFLGTLLMMTALQRFPAVLSHLLCCGQLQISNEDVARAIARAERRRDDRMAHLLMAGAALTLTSLIVLKTFESQYRNWWGHAEHGSAGLVFAFAACAMVWIGATAIHRLAVGLQLVAELFEHPVTVRPFHSDGCNGFSTFGDFLILLFFLSIALASSVSITFLGGYLRIEEFIGTWIVGSAILMMIPLILIRPLIRCTIEIGRAKQTRLATVEAVLNRALSEIERDLTERSDPQQLRASLEQLLRTRRTITAVYGPYNFPFKPRIVGFVSITYALQVALLVREALEKFA